MQRQSFDSSSEDDFEPRVRKRRRNHQQNNDINVGVLKFEGK